MRFNLLMVWIVFSFSAFAKAEDAPSFYYVGEAITTVDATVTRHPYIIERISDPVAGTILEKVVSYQKTKFVENSSVMKVDGNHFTMTESTGTVSGGGTLTGLPWKWTFLSAEFKVSNYDMRIVDYNFFADPDSILGHKDFYIRDSAGKENLILQEDVVLHRVQKTVYDAKRLELLAL